MKKLLFLSIIGLVLLTSCGNNNSNKQVKSRTTVNRWYVGETLHKAKIADWKEATDKNKLATCADFVASVDNDVSMSVLKKRAKALKHCINEATRDLESTNEMKVSEVASNCILLLGYSQ